jgi:hypothetical protein
MIIEILYVQNTWGVDLRSLGHWYHINIHIYIYNYIYSAVHTHTHNIYIYQWPRSHFDPPAVFNTYLYFYNHAYHLRLEKTVILRAF